MGHSANEENSMARPNDRQINQDCASIESGSNGIKQEQYNTHGQYRYGEAQNQGLARQQYMLELQPQLYQQQPYQYLNQTLWMTPNFTIDQRRRQPI